MSRDVRKMFDGIAARYDLVNRVLTMRRDLKWRRRTVSNLPPQTGRVLDLCGGTGDFLLAARAAGRAATDSVVADFSLPMMGHLAGKGLPRGVGADALNLPFRACSFDTVLCGFGIRNLDDPRKGISEVHRVLRPSGIFATLEFFRPDNPFTRMFHGALAPRIMPLVGRLLGSCAFAYAYLPVSVRHFLDVGAYRRMLGENGFEPVCSIGFDFGICHAVIARRSF